MRPCPSKCPGRGGRVRPAISSAIAGAAILLCACLAGCGNASNPAGEESGDQGGKPKQQGGVAARLLAEKILKDLQSDDPETANAAVHAAASSGNENLVPELLILIKSMNPMVRTRAALALGKIKNPAAFDSLLAMARDRDQYTREAGISALSAMGDPRALATLRGAVTDPNPMVRCSAVSGLAGMGDGDSFELVASRLSDEHINVRKAAINAVTLFKRRESAGRLEQVWKSDPEIRGRIWAASGLFELSRREDAFDFLIAMLKDENPVARFTAAEMLGRINDKRAIEPLMEAVKDPEHSVYVTATMSLERITQQRLGPKYEAWKEWLAKEKGKK